jgi:hypothetical protein
VLRSMISPDTTFSTLDNHADWGTKSIYRLPDRSMLEMALPAQYFHESDESLSIQFFPAKSLPVSTWFVATLLQFPGSTLLGALIGILRVRIRNGLISGYFPDICPPMTTLNIFWPEIWIRLMMVMRKVRIRHPRFSWKVSIQPCPQDVDGYPNWIGL